MVMINNINKNGTSKENKRVATLYRVSTKGQLDGNDIPMQQRACRGYIERGVSGFKVSIANRDD